MEYEIVTPAQKSPPAEGALPPEYTKPGAPEFYPPPPEFGASGESRPAEKKKKRRRMRRILAIPAAAVFGFLCLYAGGVVSLPERTRPAANASVQEQQPEDSPSGQPDEQPSQPDEEPSSVPPEEQKPTYPIADRDLVITVFSGTLSADYTHLEVVLTTRVNEAEFTSLDLPEPETIDAFSFYGYVIHMGHLDPGLRSEGEPEGAAPLIIPVGNTLTRAHVEQVPVASDGVRYVDITANWISDTDPESPEADWTFILDYGDGHRKKLDGQNPMYSEGFLYVCAYPDLDSHPGYTFEGWYNAAGERVDALQSYFSFYEPVEYDANGYVFDVDVEKPLQVVLTARWRPTE